MDSDMDNDSSEEKVDPSQHPWMNYHNEGYDYALHNEILLDLEQMKEMIRRSEARQQKRWEALRYQMTKSHQEFLSLLSQILVKSALTHQEQSTNTGRERTETRPSQYSRQKRQSIQGIDKVSNSKFSRIQSTFCQSSSQSDSSSKEDSSVDDLEGLQKKERQNMPTPLSREKKKLTIPVQSSLKPAVKKSDSLESLPSLVESCKSPPQPEIHKNPRQAKNLLDKEKPDKSEHKEDNAMVWRFSVDDSSKLQMLKADTTKSQRPSQQTFSTEKREYKDPFRHDKSKEFSTKSSFPYQQIKESIMSHAETRNHPQFDLQTESKIIKTPHWQVNERGNRMSLFDKQQPLDAEGEEKTRERIYHQNDRKEQFPRQHPFSFQHMKREIRETQYENYPRFNQRPKPESFGGQHRPDYPYQNQQFNHYNPKAPPEQSLCQQHGQSLQPSTDFCFKPLKEKMEDKKFIIYYNMLSFLNNWSLEEKERMLP